MQPLLSLVGVWGQGFGFLGSGLEPLLGIQRCCPCRFNVGGFGSVHLFFWLRAQFLGLSVQGLGMQVGGDAVGARVQTLLSRLSVSTRAYFLGSIVQSYYC